MGKKKQRGRRGGGGRPPGGMSTTTLSTISTVSGQVISTKQFTPAQLFPDIVESRDIVVHKFSVDFVNASTTVTGSTANIQANFAANTFGKPTPFRGLNNATRTRFTVTNTDQGTKVPIRAGTTTPILFVSMSSHNGAVFSLIITSHFAVKPDGVPNIIP